MRAIIFDFDGVVADSERLHERAIRNALVSLGLPAAWTDWTRYMGHGDREALAKILADQGETMDEARFALLQAAKQREISAMIERAEARAYPGSVELLLAAAAALPTGVCSGSRAHEVRPILEQFGALRSLRAVVTCDDVRRTKPDPEPYLLAADRLGAPPAFCVAIEDTPVGVRAAHAAGCVVIGVAHTNPPEALTGAGAHAVAPSTQSLSVTALEQHWGQHSAT